MSNNSSVNIGLIPMRAPKAVRHSRAWILAERAWHRGRKDAANGRVLNVLHYSTTVLSHAAKAGK